MSSFSKNKLLFCIITFLHVIGSDIMVAMSVLQHKHSKNYSLGYTSFLWGRGDSS